MRFSIRHLLLVFPAYVLAIGLANLWLATFRGPHPRWVNDVSCVRQIAMSVQRLDNDVHRSRSRTRDRQVPIEVINRLLAGDTVPEEFAWSCDGFGKYPMDSWGKPYRVRRSVKTASGDVAPAGAYSQGEDGVSVSGGNDADDINSWDPDVPAYYKEESRASRQVAACLVGVFILPVVYLIVFAVVEVLWRSHPGKKDAAPTAPAASSVE